MKIIESKINIAIIGLGYVGLPLAIEFAKKYNVVGFDIDENRITELLSGFDRTQEVSDNELNVFANSYNSQNGIVFTSTLQSIKTCNVFIVTVPTPIDKFNRPDLTPLYKASQAIGTVLKKGDLVIYESTVYPGVTEEECLPLLEKFSRLNVNKDFHLGYSPERINPGDKHYTVANIMKVTSGSNDFAAEFVDNLYKSIIIAGTFKASSIKVAEAAKVIENSQRDINIAFVNELSKIFSLMNIDTSEVLKAAATKWNFIQFKPGLVGGHCIGVDPYYLAQKAQELGYHPEVILAGRRTNDGMGSYVAKETLKKMVRKSINIVGSKILILGFTFKENCPDVRNTKVIDIYNELKSFEIDVDVLDPLANVNDVKREYNINLICLKDEQELNKYSAIILAVAHDEFKKIKLENLSYRVIYDVKGVLPKSAIDSRL
jgi:UDP-N-acetyl-D-galactosamine dehydrogenase